MSEQKKPFAITLDPLSSLQNRTGDWRVERPRYVDRLPPCNHACPAGENIQRWLFYAEEKNYQKAWQTLVVDNPFPAIHGRVCYHPCEGACNRAMLDSAVGIHSVERFLGDLAIEKQWALPQGAPPSGKRVLVVGCGPSGLSAAYHLVRQGHEVEIHDAGDKPGGMMRYGIPKYRLPRLVLDAEITRIFELGVTFRPGSKVEDLEELMSEGGFDAAFLAIGAHIGRRAEIPGADAVKILNAIDFLRELESSDSPPLLGRKVAVYGGGNTAMDAARTAKRLGAEETLIVYRRDREHAPAHEFEVQEAEEEGITVRWLRTIKERTDGGLKIERMALNDEGKPEATGEFETLEADTVILALGQQAETGFLEGVSGIDIRDDGTLEVDEFMRTGRKGVFAGGDLVPLEHTVTTAVGHGKQAARNIDAFLKESAPAHPPRHEVATYDTLNTWYYSDASQMVQKSLEPARRSSVFDEVVAGLTEETALFEARRCLSCGNCFECDNCFGMCPDNAIKKLGTGNRYEIDLDFCKGCGICAQECPCGAIEMIPEY